MARTKHGLPGIYNASAITLTDGQGSALAVNSSGQLVAAAPSGVSANQVQGTSAAGVTTTQGNPVRVGAKYKATPATRTDGQTSDLTTDTNENLNVTLATKLDPVNDGVTAYEDASSITTISTATTTVVAAFPVVVKEIRVLGGTLGNVTVYDNTAASGTTVVPAFTPDKGQVLIGKGTNFAVGCTIVTAAATILTVVWRAQ